MYHILSVVTNKTTPAQMYFYGAWKVCEHLANDHQYGSHQFKEDRFIWAVSYHSTRRQWAAYSLVPAMSFTL